MELGVVGRGHGGTGATSGVLPTVAADLERAPRAVKSTMQLQRPRGPASLSAPGASAVGTVTVGGDSEVPLAVSGSGAVSYVSSSLPVTVSVSGRAV